MTNTIKKEVLNDVPKFNSELGTCAQIPYGDTLFYADYKDTTKENKAPYSVSELPTKSITTMSVNREFRVKLCYYEDLEVPTYDRFKLFKYYGNGNNVEMVRFQAEKLVETKFCGLARPYYFMIKGRRWYIDQLTSMNDPRGDFHWDDRYSYGDTSKATTEEIIKEEDYIKVSNEDAEVCECAMNDIREQSLRLYLEMGELIKKLHNL